MSSHERQHRSGRRTSDQEAYGPLASAAVEAGTGWCIARLEETCQEE